MGWLEHMELRIPRHLLPHQYDNGFFISLRLALDISLSLVSKNNMDLIRLSDVSRKPPRSFLIEICPSNATRLELFF